MPPRNSAQSISPKWKKLPFPLKLAVAKVGAALAGDEGFWALAWIDALARPNPWSTPLPKRDHGSADGAAELGWFFVQFFSFLQESCANSENVGAKLARCADVLRRAGQLSNVHPGQYAFVSHSRVLIAYQSERRGRLLPPRKADIMRRIRLAGENEGGLKVGQRANQSKVINKLGLLCIDGRKLMKPKLSAVEKIRILGIEPSEMSVPVRLECLYWWKTPEQMETFSTINGCALNLLSRRLGEAMHLQEAEKRILSETLIDYQREAQISRAGNWQFQMDSPSGTFFTTWETQPSTIRISIANRKRLE